MFVGLRHLRKKNSASNKKTNVHYFKSVGLAADVHEKLKNLKIALNEACLARLLTRQPLTEVQDRYV